MLNNTTLNNIYVIVILKALYLDFILNKLIM